MRSVTRRARVVRGRVGRGELVQTWELRKRMARRARGRHHGSGGTGRPGGAVRAMAGGAGASDIRVLRRRLLRVTACTRGRRLRATVVRFVAILTGAMTRRCALSLGRVTGRARHPARGLVNIVMTLYAVGVTAARESYLRLAGMARGAEHPLRRVERKVVRLVAARATEALGVA